jgi:hypothetical protein
MAHKSASDSGAGRDRIALLLAQHPIAEGLIARGAPSQNVFGRVYQRCLRGTIPSEREGSRVFIYREDIPVIVDLLAGSVSCQWTPATFPSSSKAAVI